MIGEVGGEDINHNVVKSTCRLDVYGAVRQASGASESNHKFVGALGHTSEDNTGLIYMRARYYDPSIGRFISEDPVKNGINWYTYCSNNPINLVDADGTDEVPVSVWARGLAMAAIGTILIISAIAMAAEAYLPSQYAAAASTADVGLAFFGGGKSGSNKGCSIVDIEGGGLYAGFRLYVYRTLAEVATGAKTEARIAIVASAIYGVYVWKALLDTDTCPL